MAKKLDDAFQGIAVDVTLTDHLSETSITFDLLEAQKLAAILTALTIQLAPHGFYFAAGHAAPMPDLRQPRLRAPTKAEIDAMVADDEVKQ